MTKIKQSTDSITEVRDLLKKLLVLKLFEMNVSQVEIAKKIHTDLNVVNNLLKNVKKNNHEKNKRTKNGHVGAN